jgi:septum formation protein
MQPISSRLLILASASPRRQWLLKEAGYDFEVRPADIDEEAFPRDMAPSDLARRIAIAKAEKISAAAPDALVLAADTIVAFGEQILGKPADADAARRMLQLLSGTTHIVITGVSLLRGADRFARGTRVMSAVRMRMLKRSEIDAYVASNDWQGKAGGYGIQDADPFVTCIAGCSTNVVGLPMTTTKAMLAEAGMMPRG